MKYCCNCRNTFPDEDVVREADGETARYIYSCPRCGVDDLADAQQCAVCGEWFPEEELSYGFCLQCLWEAIDYDIALDYLKHTDKLCSFILSDWFGGGELSSTSNALLTFMEETFRRLVASDKLMHQMGCKPDFLVACRYACLPQWPKDFGLDGSAFAEWYKDQKGAAS